MKVSNQFWAAAGLIVLGALLWVAGVWIGFSADQFPAWLSRIAGWMFAGSFPVGAAGALWLLVLAVRALRG